MSGREFDFAEHDTFLFGRKSDCHVHISGDGFVSRHHFILEANPPQARLRDLGSMNGTFVNGDKCGGRLQGESPDQGAERAYPQFDLSDGDTIRVGETVFRVAIERTGPAVRVQCQQCGRDVSREADAGEDGEYICAQCRQDAAEDPLRLLRQRNAPNEAEERMLIQGELEDYEIERPLGRGGMGAVYLARRMDDDARVALKVMLAKVVVDERARQAFLREMDTLRDLEHPNIVRFIEGGATGGAFFFVMEYCNKGSLSTLIDKRGGRVPLRIAAPIMLQVLKGLAYAHEKGLVHRDLNPNNILIHEEDGVWRPKVSDFGLAKNFERAGFSGLTATQGYSGTFSYVPREQVTSFRYVKPVSDVWSAGATFYTMLTGAFPRLAGPDADPLNVVLEADATPITQCGVPLAPDVAAVIDKALATNPRKRYADAGEFRQALKKALREACSSEAGSELYAEDVGAANAQQAGIGEETR